MARVKIYIDESGFGQKPVYVMAGWLATAEHWAAFSDEWQQSLDMRPRIQYFHMDEAMNLDGEFADWREDARDEKLRLLNSVITSRLEHGLTCSVLHTDYDAVRDGISGHPLGLEMTAAQVREIIRNPYYYLFFSAIQLGTRLSQSIWPDAEIDFVFDDQVMEKGRVLDAWEDFKSHQWERVKVRRLLVRTPTFADDKAIRPLQAADIQAWICRRRWLERVNNISVLEVPMFLRDQGRGRIAHKVWNAKDMADLLLSAHTQSNVTLSGTARHALGGCWIA